MLGNQWQYCLLYELPLVEHLGVLIWGLNRIEDVQKMAASADPQQALLDALDQEVEDNEDNDSVDAEDLVCMTYSLGRTMRSMATYGRSISGLLKDVRDNNNIDSLFKAIRIDRAVIGCPTAMNHIARAQIRNNKAFFKRLRAAMAGQSKKEWAGLDQMRFAFLLLREMGVDNLSASEVEALMVDKLNVYKAGSGDARKNLNAQYHRFKRFGSI